MTLSAEEKKDVQRLAAGVPLEVYYLRSVSRGVTGIEVSVLVSFILGAIAGGFLSEMGKDCWAAMKAIVKRLFGTSSRKSPIRIEILLHEQLTKTTVRVRATIGNNAEFDEVFENIHDVCSEFLSGRVVDVSEICIGKATLSLVKDEELVKYVRREYEKIASGGSEF